MVVGRYAFGSHSSPNLVEHLRAEFEVFPVHYILNRGIRFRLKQIFSLIAHSPGGLHLVDLVFQAIAWMLPDNLQPLLNLINGLIDHPELVLFVIQPIIKSGLDIKHRILDLLELLELLLEVCKHLEIISNLSVVHVNATCEIIDQNMQRIALLSKHIDPL